MLVVSLTSIASRVHCLTEVLETLTAQSMAPDQIVVWLSEEPFLLDRGIRPDEVPSELGRLERTSRIPIDIRFTENIGPLRKIIPTLDLYKAEQSSLIVVTADDDQLYRRYWLESLYRGYERRACAVAFRARSIAFENTRPAPYSTWLKISPDREVFSSNLIVTGTKGHLLTAEMLSDKFFSDDYKRLCPSRSDIWIGAALLAKKTPTLKLSISRIQRGDTATSVGNRFKAPKTGYLDRAKSLWVFNEDKNDQLIVDTFQHFGLLYPE